MKLFKVGLVGSIIAAICCFTPMLVWIFGLLGLASIIVYLDYVLLPMLGLFIIILIIGIIRILIAKPKN